jgi:hypothetical protein
VIHTCSLFFEGDHEKYNLFDINDLSFFVCTTQAFAQMTEKEIQTEIADNVAGEYIDCGVYFNIVSEGAEKAGRLSLAKEYSNLVDQCYGSAYLLIKSNRDEEMASKVSTSLVSMTDSSMRDEIENNFSNLSVLSNKNNGLQLLCQ